MKIKDLPVAERPYEKAVRFGVSTLSDAELLSIIIRSGNREERSTEMAAKLLEYSNRFPGLDILYHIDFRELVKIKGIGRVKALQLLSVAELSKRLSRTGFGENIVFDCPETAATYYMNDMRHLEHEEFRCVCLDAKKQLISCGTIFVGSVNKSFAEPREILKYALKENAVYIIILHNHPSGDPAPSDADVSATRRIREASDIVGIRLFDHLIIGNNRYISFKEAGLL